MGGSTLLMLGGGQWGGQGEGKRPANLELPFPVDPLLILIMTEQYKLSLYCAYIVPSSYKDN